MKMDMDIVDFAYQVIEMDKRIRDLEFENSRLRRFEHDYNKLLKESLVHSHAMMGNTLKLFLTPGVIEACQELKIISSGVGRTIKMNERIFELAQQANEYATTRHPVSNIALSVNSEKFVKKFAELIVRSCSNIAAHHNSLDAAEDIMKHFGVEE